MNSEFKCCMQMCAHTHEIVSTLLHTYFFVSSYMHIFALCNAIISYASLKAAISLVKYMV